MTKQEFSALVAAGPVLLDGATGSNLMARGMPRGVCTEAWIYDHPQMLVQLQREYVMAGSRILYAPTFSANRLSLARHEQQARVRELNTALVALSREAAGGSALVAGDMTTTGELLEPLGALEPEELFSVYQEQAQALVEAGVDLVVIETMLCVEETAIALKAVQSACDLPVLCSLSVQEDGRAIFGGDCFSALEQLQALGAAAVGINCSCGPEQMLPLVRKMGSMAKVPLLVKPNAGIPEVSVSGELTYPMTAEEFAGHMKALVAEGATLIGGCCGTTPEFIAGLRGLRK